LTAHSPGLVQTLLVPKANRKVV